jgi:hypothetical protein
VSHPDPAGPADLRPFHVGDELQNPVTGEFARILELPWENPDGRGRAELLAVVGARVLGGARPSRHGGAVHGPRGRADRSA